MRTASYAAERLRPRSAAFALLARILGPDLRALVDDETLSALRNALDRAGDMRLSERLADPGIRQPLDTDELAGKWVRWFDLGRVAPYEGSNVPPTAGGVTPRLADISGFYSAFGLAVHKERPDHLVVELEFMATLLVMEAEARDNGDHERADITCEASRTFLRDHLGTWVTAWASRVADVEDLAPWAPFAAVAAELVQSECHDRHVIPVRLGPVLTADAGVPSPEESQLACGDEPLSERGSWQPTSAV